MHLRSVGMGIGLAALGLATTLAPPVRADDRGVVGKKLVIIDKLAAAGKAKVVFVSKDTAPGAIHKGPGADPPGLGGSMSVFPLSDVTGNRGEFALDDGADGAWLVNKDAVAKYVNKEADVGALGVKVAVVKPDKVLKVVAKNLGDGDAAAGDDGPMDLDPAAVSDTDTVRVVVTIEKHEGNGVFTTHRMCADFADLIVKSIGGGTGTKIVSKASSAPADCDDFTVTTTTTPGGTTTTTTIATACDVFTQDCPSGFGCYPTFGDPAADCTAAGAGGLGAGCTQNTDCAPGLICVVDAQGGVCHQICQVGGAQTCPGQLFCEPAGTTGIPDFGICNVPTTTTVSTTTTTTTLPTARIAFVTAGTFTATQVGGLGGADGRCNTAAAAAGLPGTYRAWISHCASAASPSNRFSDGPPWVRVDGAPIADNLADLLDGGIDNPLNVTETGSQVPFDDDVWTGTDADGTLPSSCLSNTCNDWTSSVGMGLTGEAWVTGPRWTADNQLSCSTFRHLYCFQQDATGATTTSTTSTISTTSTTSTTIAPATCDVFLQDCVSGFGCYPTGSDPEAVCAPAGSGGQGSTCSHSGQCQAGFVCLVSAQGGFCGEICEVGGAVTCSNGTFCSSVPGTGIPGFGACF